MAGATIAKGGVLPKIFASHKTTPDPTYGVGRENEPLRSWGKNFGVT